MAEEELARMKLEFPEIKSDCGWTAESLEDAISNIGSFSEHQNSIQNPSFECVANLSGTFVKDTGFAQQTLHQFETTHMFWSSRNEPAKPQWGEGML